MVPDPSLLLTFGFRLGRGGLFRRGLPCRADLAAVCLGFRLGLRRLDLACLVAGCCAAVSAGFGSRFGLRDGGLGPVGQDLGDPDQREFLPVAALAARILAAALLEGDDLRAAALIQHFGRDRCARDGRVARASTLSPPTTSTSPNWMISPGSPATFSTFNLSSAATRYCLPPVLMTANIFPSCSVPRLGRPSRVLGAASCSVGLFECFRRPEAAKTQNERACPKSPSRAHHAYGGAGRACQDDGPGVKIFA